MWLVHCMAVSSSCEDALMSRPPARFIAPCYKAALRALVIDCNDAIKEACRRGWAASPWRGRGPVTVARCPFGCQVASPVHDKQ